MGHAVDFTLFHSISEKQEFIDIYNKESKEFFNKPYNEGFNINAGEYFAQAFYNYYYSDGTKKDLKAELLRLISLLKVWRK